MNRAALSVFVWGIYMLFSGSAFLFIPDTVLPLFGFSPTTEGWVRVVGLLVGIVGAYYIDGARNNFILFFKMTVFGRLAFALGTLFLVLLNLSQPPLLIIGTTDAIGAIWTWLSLRSMAQTKGQEAIARA